MTRKNGVIIPGSKANFTILLNDEDDNPISLSAFVSGKLYFCNKSGTRSEIVLDVPGSNPDKGQLAVEILSAVTADADAKWKDADLELIDGDDEPTIIPLSDMFEIDLRNCPPVIP